MELLYAAFAATTNRVFFVRGMLPHSNFFMYRIHNAFALASFYNCVEKNLVFR